METTGAKLVAAVILLGVPAVAIVGAWLALRWGRGQGSGRGLAALNCLAGGVFLGTCFLHLAVEGRERWADYLLQSGRTVDFPIFEAIMVAGLFVVLFLDSTASFAAKRFALWTVKHRRQVLVVACNEETLGQDDRTGKLNAGCLADKSDEKNVNFSARETANSGPDRGHSEPMLTSDGTPDPDRVREPGSSSAPDDSVALQLLGDFPGKDTPTSNEVSVSSDTPECRLLMEYCSESNEESSDDISKASSILDEWSFPSETSDTKTAAQARQAEADDKTRDSALRQGHGVLLRSDNGTTTHDTLQAVSVDSASLQDVLLSDNHLQPASISIQQGSTAETRSMVMDIAPTGVLCERRRCLSSEVLPGSVRSASSDLKQRCDDCGRVAPIRTNSKGELVESIDSSSSSSDILSSATESSTSDSITVSQGDLDTAGQYTTAAFSTTVAGMEGKPAGRTCGQSHAPSSELDSHSGPGAAGDSGGCGPGCLPAECGRPGKDGDWGTLAPGSSMGLVVLVMALAFHTVFDGLAVGLQSSVSAVWQTTGVISLHRGVVTFCLALQLLPALRPRAALPLLALAALAAPLGLLLGLVVTSASDVTGLGGSSLACSALQGLAAGTFLYVTFFEILKDELVREGHPVKVVLVMAGFAISAGLKCIDV